MFKICVYICSGYMRRFLYVNPDQVNVDRKGGCNLGWTKHNGVGKAKLAFNSVSMQLPRILYATCPLLSQVVSGSLAGGVEKR